MRALHSILFLLALSLLIPLPGCAAAPVSAPAPVGLEVPILMYHSVLKDPAKNGKYVVSPDELEQDLLYLSQQGYTTVFLSELVDFVEGRGALPAKPVVITFDDGYLNFITYALPILEEHDMKAVLSVVGEYTRIFSETPDPNPNYAHCTFEDIRMLSLSGLVEIQNHSDNLHSLNRRRGSSRMAGESAADYRAIFIADAEKLQAELTEKSGVIPICYTYPLSLIHI